LGPAIKMRAVVNPKTNKTDNGPFMGKKRRHAQLQREKNIRT